MAYSQKVQIGLLIVPAAQATKATIIFWLYMMMNLDKKLYLISGALTMLTSALFIASHSIDNVYMVIALSLIVSLAWASTLKKLTHIIKSMHQHDIDEKLISVHDRNSKISSVLEDSQTQLLDAKNDLGHARKIQSEAIEGLINGFRGLENDARYQVQLIHELMSSISKTSGSPQEDNAVQSETSELIQLFVDSISTMKDGSLELVNSLNSLGERLTEIDKMLSEIDGISGQTNLLALNAAIEAARAGETGRGFAVVADEVRTLSLRSNHFSNEIREIFSDISKKMQTAGNIVAKMASRDMSLALDSQVRIDEILNDMHETNAKVATGLNSVSSVTDKISANVGILVQSLQFEDMNNQLLDYTSNRMELIKSVLNTITEEGLDSEVLIEKLPSLESSNSSDVPNKAVLQQGMGVGDINLF